MLQYKELITMLFNVKMKTFSLLILITILSVHGNASAKQLSFFKKPTEDGYQFNYEWLDAQKQHQRLSFVLSNNTLFSTLRNFRAYKSKNAQQKVNKYILKSWRKKPIEKANLTLQKQQGMFQLVLNASSDEAFQTASNHLRDLEGKAWVKYFEQSYYHEFTRYTGGKAIKPDHTRMANLFVEDFKPIKPLILESVDIKNISNATNYVLGFSQSIPYSPLSSRVTSSGAGFNPPPKVLWENQGDCDSKVTLTASILRSLMPRIKMVLVFIEGHALIGINTTPKDDDLFITFEEETFVLAEPTGPASLMLGDVSPTSEQAILAGLYTAEAYYREESEE